MAKQIVDLAGLTTFVGQLKEVFATKEYMSDVEQNTNTYILNVDYTDLEFDTSEVVI